MKNFALKFLALITAFALFTTSCKKEKMNDPGGNPSGMTFKEIIDSGGAIGDPTISSTPDTIDSQNNIPIGDGTFNCTTVTYNVNAAGGGDSGFPLFNPTAEVIYPGSMLQGNSLHKATPNSIVVSRAGGTISIDILDGNLVSSIDVDEVKRSTITDGINNIIANATGTLPANFNIQVESIQSEEQFALALGVDVSTAFTELNSKLKYESSSEKSSFLVSLNQSYYTMSFDLPTSLDQLFAPSVTPDQLEPYVGPGNPATYISSVTYGRIFYMLIESTSSESDLQLAVDGAFSGVTVDIEGSVDMSHFSSVENVTYSMFAYGGDAATSFNLFGQTDINQLKEDLKASTSLGSGKPLSYVVRNVADNQIVSTQLATQYDVVECEQISTEGTLPAIVHWTNHPLLEDFGPITAAYADNNEKFILINEQGEWLRSTINGQGEGILEGPFPWGGGNLPFSSIGAACRLQGPGAKLYVFNGLGNKYATWDNGAWGPTHDISEWFGGDIPFVNAGVGALNYFGDYTVAGMGHTHFMFDESGTNVAFGRWEIPPFQTGHYLGGATDVSSVTDEKIDAVGAALGFVNGNTFVQIFINKLGTEYVVHADFGSGTTETKGPFSL